MKKRSSLFIALCLGLLFTACNASDPENLFEMPLETTQTVATTALVAAVEEDYYQYGNMQKSLPPGNFMRYGDEILFTSIVDGRNSVYTYDMATGEVSFLCKDATCTHTYEENCLSNKVWGNLEQYQGKLYADSDDDTSSMDGIHRSKILELRDGQFEEIIDGDVVAFWHANGNLYVKTADSSLLIYENGSDTSRVLLDEYTNEYNTVFGQYLYGFGIFEGTLSRVDLLADNPQEEILLENCGGVCSGIIDGQYIYYSDLEDEYHLYRCDMDGSNPELLVEQPVYATSLNFDDEYLYFRLFKLDDKYGDGSHELYRMPKDGSNGMEIIAELPETIHTVYTVPGYDKIFVTVRIIGEDGNATFPIYVVGTDGSDIKLLELPDY